MYAPKSGVYFEQRSCVIRGNLNLAAFRQAWQRVVERHSVLRTAFHYSELEKPLQVVYDNVELPWQELDWCGLEVAAQQAKLTEFLESDCNCGFNLQQPPLMRCAVIRLEANKYQFIWSHHHLLMDGWCNGILLTEVFTLYKSFCQGQDVTLPSPVPYGNYILWLQQQNPEQAASYWRKQLQDFTAPTVLGNRDWEEVDERKSSVNSQQTETLQNFVRQHRLTLNTLVQGAWALLLSRYSGENDVLFGTTVSGRPPELPQVERIVGLFINTLPVRVDVDGEMQIIPWLQQLQAQQVEREQYSYSSLVDIQGWSSVPRGTSLFDSLLVFENYPVSIESVIKSFDQTLQIEDTQGVEKTNYPLTLTVIPGQELLFKVSYDVSCFDAAMILRLLGHLETLLMSMVNEPEQRLSQLSLLTPQERQLILNDWNQTTQPYPNQCIHQLFEAQVERTPDAVALVFGEECLTYRELNNKANQLAHYLQQLGVKPEILVGVCVERSPKMLIGILGVLKAGGVYLPLDPTYPDERVRWILADAQVGMMFAPRRKDAKEERRVVCLDADWEGITLQSIENPISNVTGESLAYVIYTSGSTGKPKGVMIEQRSLTNLITALQQQLGICYGDSWLAITTIAFDIAALELFLPLIVGARVILTPQTALVDPSQIAAIIEQQQITVMQATPATWRLLIAHGWEGKADLKILCGGEALDKSLAQQLLSSGQEVWNLYGPTETTIWSAAQKLIPDEPVTIGHPIPNTQIYILDQHLQPVPIGVPGELYIGGAGVARGYLNRPELTAERFIGDWGLGITPLSTLYKTGDRARYLPDGTIEYLGRVDNQVKIRGFRIELGEIEAVLSQHPQVSASVVVVTEDTTGDKRLVAYIVSENPELADLRQFLAKHLPDYMIPSQFITLDALPLTPNGKLDRRALPKPQFKTSSHTIAPRTPTEELLLNIWQSILNLNSVGITDNFFALGGHSLLIIRLVSQIQQVFGVDISLRQIFENPTIAELATLINSSKLSLYSSIPVRESTDEILLSFAQQRLWMLAQIEPENPSYNVAAALRLTGDVNVDVLTQSLQEIIQRHEVLRTSFVNVDGQGIAVIATEINFLIPVVDLSFIPPSQQQKLVQELAQEESQQPFNLEISPLLRAKLLYLNTHEYILLLTMHHIITDGWSINIFAQEMASIYQAFSQGKSSPLQPLKIQYADFAVWQRSQNDKFNYQLEYWRQQLESAPELLELPTDYPRPAIQTFRGQRHSFTISEELTEKIKQLGQETHTTLFMVMFSALNILLHRYSQQEKIVIGSPVANRHYPGTEGLIGFFVNTFALLISLLQAAPIAFDASTFEVWGALLNGSRLVILSSQQPTLAEIGQAITDYQITTLWLTAGLFHLMVDEHLESLKSVKQLIAGGDVLSTVHINKLLQTHSECRVINGYGPTENTTFTCCHSVTDICEGNTVPIGHPINNTQVYILDNHLNPVPIGVPGELYIAGDGLARGYLNQPTLTAEKFTQQEITNYVSVAGRSPLRITNYKTGDRARYLADGTIEYLGRLDNQVKIRGFRIELGEIEAVLNQHPAVKECVVIAREKQLIAYFIPSDSTPDNLREFLQQRLPDYLIPHFFVALETLPLTVNGKVDRQKLPAPEITSFPDGTVPRSDIEAKLVEIWSSVLNLSQVSIYDNFFALGGDSILAIQVIAKANQLGLQLTPKQLFQYQTIAEVAGFVTVDKSSLLPQGMVTGAVRLTPIQFWFFEQELVNQHHFNQVVFLESGERLESEILAEVVRGLLLHHDMLRCQFGFKNCFTQRRKDAKEEIGGEVVELGGDVPLVFCDLSVLSGGEQDRVIQEVSGEVQNDFNITHAPLLRVVHFDLGEVSRLLIVIHHLVVDGVSWRVLLEDFQTAYQQALAKQTINLPVKTTSFLSWAEKLYDYARSECLQDELEYWLSNKYQQVKPLPIDYPDGGNQVVDVETVTIKLSVEDTQALLTEVYPVYNTQINDVLLTALTATISTWINNPLVLLDLEGYGRNFPGEDIDISRTVGWFTAIYPCLLSKESDDWGEMLKGIKEQLRTVPNQGFGYGILRYIDDGEASQRLRDLPQAEISFNYLGQLDLGLEHGKLKWLPLPGITTQDKQQTRRYAIEIIGFVREGKLQFDWIYSQQQYQQETISQLANNFQQGLQAIINHCRLPDAGGYTPSDFDLANLNQETLDLVMGMISFAPEGLQ